jgi:hypothetical protein
MLLCPRYDLSVDDPLLHGGHQRLALGDRRAEVLWPLRLLVEHRGLNGIGVGAIVAGDLQKDPHAHGEPPPLTAGNRAFHKRRCGKPKASPARWPRLFWLI